MRQVWLQRFGVPKSSYKRGEPAYVIDPDKCTECVGNYESPGCVDTSRLGASVPKPDNVESREQLLEEVAQVTSR